MSHDDGQIAAYFLRLAYETARDKSHDPRTQNGAVIVEPNYRGMSALGVAANSYPPGAKHAIDKLGDLEKYAKIEHAERAVIYRASRYQLKLKGATMYCPWAACADCARAIVAVGIKAVVVHEPVMAKTPERWQKQVTEGLAILKAYGVEVTRYLEPVGGVTILFNGEVWHP